MLSNFAKSNKNYHKSKTNRINYLWIIFFVKKFANILKATIFLKRMSKLNSYHFKILNEENYKSINLNQKKIIKLNNPFAIVKNLIN